MLLFGGLIFVMPWLLIFSGNYLLSGFWYLQVYPGIPFYWVLAGVPALIGCGLMGCAEDEAMKEERSSYRRAGVCPECGGYMGNYTVGCRTCPKVFCSDACARRHYYSYHGK